MQGTGTHHQVQPRVQACCMARQPVFPARRCAQALCVVFAAHVVIRVVAVAVAPARACQLFVRGAELGASPNTRACRRRRRLRLMRRILILVAPRLLTAVIVVAAAVRAAAARLVRVRRARAAEQLDARLLQLLVKRQARLLQLAHHLHARGVCARRATARCILVRLGARKVHGVVRKVNVHGVLVVRQAANVRHWRVQQPLAVVQAAPLGGARQRAGVGQRGHL
jgi:hypothetical protein